VEAGRQTRRARSGIDRPLRRKLIQDRSEPRFELPRVLEGAGEREETARLHLAPFRKRLGRRQAIEAVVDFDRIEYQRVMRKPAGYGKLSRVEITAAGVYFQPEQSTGLFRGIGLTTPTLRG
jgi:hypothetical protein